jgi:hypothetical protein
MNSENTHFQLGPAGYLILQEPEHARSSNEYNRSFGYYCGVDRIPPLFPPDVAIKVFGANTTQHPRLNAAIFEWLDDARSPISAFIPSRKQATNLLSTFKSFGLPLDLIFCELAWQADDKDRVKSYSPVDDDAPPICQTYGFDVSWPSCTHSAILQPGLVPSNPAWRQRLNANGLLNDYRDAFTLRDEYLKIYPSQPFDIYRVHKVQE